MPAYVGADSISKCYVGAKQMDMGLVGLNEVCGDDGLVHFTPMKDFYLQAFKSTGRDLGMHKILQFNNFAMHHSNGSYPINTFAFQTAKLTEYIQLNITATRQGIIDYCSEIAENGYRDESVCEFDLYERTAGQYTYVATGHFKDWHTTGNYQMCTWDRVNEFLPAKKSRYFVMEIFTAHSFSDVRKLYFPKMWFEDENHRGLKMKGNDSYSTPQDSGSSVDILFDGHPDTYYNSRNSLHPIKICFETADGAKAAITSVGIMGKNVSEQVPATFRISAADSSYRPLWEVAMVKQPVHKSGFAWREWDTTKWPAKITLDYVV